jgi:hypothetical protein
VPLHKVVKEGRKPFRTETVFKIKEEQDGSTQYKSRIVSLGYDMIPGKDYTDAYSPVATDSSTRIAFGISLYIIVHPKQRHIVGLDFMHENSCADARTIFRWLFDETS